MSTKITPLTGAASGFPEYLPAQQRGIDLAFGRIKKVYESFGYTPLETAVMEKVETLLAKGISAKEVYGIRRLNVEDGDDGAKDLALRFDLTVPTARYLTQNYGSIVFPFRRYQVQPVWRGERPQAGRYRQFYQFDIDMVGDATLPLAADAEILAAGATALQALNVGSFTLRINNRKLLQGLLEWAGFRNEKTAPAIKIIDDAEKAGWEKTATLLTELSPEGQTEQLIPLLQSSNLEEVAKLSLNEKGKEGLAELTQILSIARQMVDEEMKNVFAPDLIIARGLDYYTGTVVETKLHAAPELGSIMSGGRYENLTANLGKKTLPGVGISIGVSRLMVWLLAQPEYTLPATPATVFIACQNETLLAHTSALARTLRQAGLTVEQHLGGQALGTQFKNADKRGIPMAIIVGESEATEGTAMVKNLKTGEQTKVSQKDLPKMLASRA